MPARREMNAPARVLPANGRFLQVIIDASELTTFEVAADGSRVRLNLLDTDGREFAVILPIECATSLLMTLPAIQKQALQAMHNDPSMRVVYPVQGWRLESSDEPGCIILTLATADGFQVSFALDSTAILDIARTLEDAFETVQKTLQ